MKYNLNIIKKNKKLMIFWCLFGLGLVGCTRTNSEAALKNSSDNPSDTSSKPIKLRSKRLYSTIENILKRFNRPIFQNDLDKFTHLTISQTYWSSQGPVQPDFFAADFLRLKNLKSLEIVFRTADWANNLITSAPGVASITLKFVEKDPIIRAALRELPIPLASLASLKKATNLNNLTLSQLKSEDIRNKNAPWPPNLKHLGLSNLINDFSDDDLLAIGSLPKLVSLSLRLPFENLKTSGQITLAQKVKSVQIYRTLRFGTKYDCGSLDIFRPFNKATYMSIEGCEITSLDPTNQVAWMALLLGRDNQSRAAGSPIIAINKIKFSNLISFKSLDPSAIDLDQSVKADLEAKKTHEWNERVITMIYHDMMACPAPPSEGLGKTDANGLLSRLFNCFRPMGQDMAGPCR